MNTTRILLLASLLPCIWVCASSAETVVIPIGSQAEREAAGPLPEQGVSRARVRASWGEPEREHAAVGKPPIERWEYPAFDVYFEYDHVVHAVAHHKTPAPIVEQPELQEDQPQDTAPASGAE